MCLTFFYAFLFQLLQAMFMYFSKVDCRDGNMIGKKDQKHHSENRNHQNLWVYWNY